MQSIVRIAQERRTGADSSAAPSATSAVDQPSPAEGDMVTLVSSADEAHVAKQSSNVKASGAAPRGDATASGGDHGTCEQAKAKATAPSGPPAKRRSLRLAMNMATGVASSGPPVKVSVPSGPPAKAKRGGTDRASGGQNGVHPAKQESTASAVRSC